MITAFFSPPGGGKTATLTIIAQKELKRIQKGRSVFKYVYTNFPCAGCFKINVADLGRYYIHDALVILDEVTLELDSRSWKDVSRGLVEFITVHRHLNIDIVYAVQDWSRAEKTLRENTVALYYLYRSPAPFFNRWATAKQIFRKIDINEHRSELVLGYRFSDWKDRLFKKCSRRFYLPKAFKYYNSWDSYGIDHRPELINRNWNEKNE